MAPSNSKELSPPIFSSVEDEMGQLISRHDWSNTPLGPIDTWSPTLELMVRILLANRFPMLLWWGSDYIQIYNDSYRPILGVKHHERALGIPVRECWDEIWHVLKPLIDRPFSGGAPTWMEDIELEINRFGFEEETHFTISYSAVPDSVAPGGIGGVLATVTEITEKVLAQRRLLALRDLGSNTVDLKSAEMACSKSAKILSKYTRDVPFSLFYLFDADKKTARLTDTTGIINSPAFVRKELNLADESSCPLPIQNVITTGALSTVTLKDHFENQPETLFGQPPKAAVIIPIQSGREAEMSGVVIAGVNPRIPYDNHYHDFFELIGDHVAASVNLARSYEAERRRAESLVELDKAKTDFFSNISHELRTPLTLMIGPLEDMLRESESVLSQKQAHDVELAYKNSLRLLKLVNSMLDFSRIEAGRANAVYERIDIVRLTYDLVTVFHSATDRAGLTLKVETGPDPIDAYVDREMWEKILLNLLSNAFKFTYSGGITVRLSSKNAQIKVEVEDTGTGISQENLPHIFERFYRVEGARGRTHEGTGIGLALVQELVKLHGGTITVESKIGQGTKFTIFIPAGKSHLPPTQIAPERTKSPSSRRAVAFVEEAKGWTAKKEGSLSLLKSEIEVKSDLKMLPDPQSTAGSRILLVDDNSDMRDYVAGLLSEYWSVEFAHDGFEALIKINRSKYDLIITDSMMPHLDGFGLIQELRKDPNTVGMPVIMLSARAGEEAKMEGLNAGADDYLVKPFSARELVGRVHAALKINKIRQEAKTEADRYRQEIYNFLMQIPSPIVVLMGPKYRFSLANPAYENMVGQKVLGKELLEAFKGPQIHEFVKLLDHVYKTGEPYFGQEIPVFLPGSDGDREERFINVTYHPYRDHTGEIKGILAVHQDVTDQKNIQDRLLHAKDDAERASQLKSAFLANMSHEIRTPLGIMLGFTDLIVDPKTSQEDREHFANVLKKNGEQLSVIINDILDLSKVEAGELRIELQNFSLQSVVEDVFSSFEVKAKEKKIRLTANFSNETGRHIMSDKVRVKQIIWNLIGNAIKFTDSGEINLHCSRNGNFITVEVRDTGIGIPTEFQGSLFKPFSQVDQSNTRKYGGTGLGLALSKKLARNLGGDLVLKESSPGKGSIFKLTLEDRETHEFTDQKSEEKTEASSNAPTPEKGDEKLLEKCNVLLVEDSEDNQNLISLILGRRGARITIAKNGAEGVEKAMSDDYDLVLMDLQMPVMDGYTATQTLRERGYNKPIIALTAHAMQDVRDKCIEAGCTDHLVKPINFAELIKTVRLYGTLQNHH